MSNSHSWAQCNKDRGNNICTEERQSRPLGMVQQKTQSLEKSPTSRKQGPIKSQIGESQKLFQEDSISEVNTPNQKQYG